MLSQQTSTNFTSRHTQTFVQSKAGTSSRPRIGGFESTTIANVENVTALRNGTDDDFIWLKAPEIVIAVIFFLVGFLCIVGATYSASRFNSKEEKLRKIIAARKLRGGGPRVPNSCNPDMININSSASVLDISNLPIPPLMKPTRQQVMRRMSLRSKGLKTTKNIFLNQPMMISSAGSYLQRKVQSVRSRRKRTKSPAKKSKSFA